ncbi:MAG: hypothetical protein HN842_02825 [Gammaproteobacteria bacterium]|jgi:hypothetical protein|nr:hypothetical protein [Gammaproteobacteria bacterium]
MKNILKVFSLSLIHFMLIFSVFEVKAELQQKISDLIPDAINVEYLSGFVTHHVRDTDRFIKVTGTVNQEVEIVVTKYKNKHNSFVFETIGGQVELDDFIGIKNKILSRFAFTSFKYHDAEIVIDAAVNNKST